ncbi:MAG: hypothetical protein CL625_00415 [Arenimonas sp.]|nr:hypothetical protein [Arenimonas sp.]
MTHNAPPSGPLFQSAAWLQATAQSVAGQVVQVPGPEHLGLVQRRMGPFRVQGLPLAQSATPLSAGLVGEGVQVARQLEALQAWFGADRPSLLQVTSPEPPPASCRPARVEILDNLELDLSPDCARLWAGLSDLPRRMVRKAMRERIRVAWRRPDGQALQAHREISRALFAAQGQAPIVAPLQYAALAHPPLRDHAHLFIASRKGRILGSLLALADAHTGYYWDVAIAPHARELGTGHLLLWAWMRDCKRRGISRLDLIGPPDPGRGGGRAGIGRFKVSFGARPRRYHVVYWHSAIAGAALDLRRRWQTQAD